MRRLLDRLGEMPLPPYIHEKLQDQSRYQTVYAKAEGSAAAPTAGLRFTPALLEQVRAMGVTVVPVLLHVGLGTFRPVKEEDVDKHVMHSEYYQVTREAADTLNRIRQAGGRLICVGTTSVRTIETVADDAGDHSSRGGGSGYFHQARCEDQSGGCAGYELPFAAEHLADAGEHLPGPGAGPGGL